MTKPKKAKTFRFSEVDTQNLEKLQAALKASPASVGTINQTSALSWALQIALNEARKLAA